jgi:hypothetical protein
MKVLVVTAVTMAAASAPAIMVAAAAAAHMPAPMPMAALHLDQGVVLCDASRCHSEPCRSRRGDRKGCGKGRDGKQRNAFHERFSRIA